MARRSAASFCPVDLPPDLGTRYLLTVDAEEEFDWSAPRRRTGFGLGHFTALPRFHDVIAPFGVKPLYLVDWPVVEDDTASTQLAGLVAHGDASIGLQHHPWVTPPFDEALNDRNSYPGNLPPALERAKLSALSALIIQRFGTKPLIHRAGRYGIGPHTASILSDLGIRFDSSVRPRFDYRSQAGPNHVTAPLSPYWVGDTGVIELPLTAMVTGRLADMAWPLFARTERWPATRGVLARLGIMERIALTPEGIPAAKACAAIDEAIARGVPLLVLSFHSPSLEPGHTPYVRDAADLTTFLAWWPVVLRHLAKRGVRPITIESLDACLDRTPAANRREGWGL